MIHITTSDGNVLLNEDRVDGVTHTRIPSGELITIYLAGGRFIETSGPDLKSTFLQVKTALENAQATRRR